MTANGATMYGTEWCPHCKAQKEEFGNSFKLIDYVDCDKYMQQCQDAGVEGYPTWKINGTNYPGTQNLYDLAKNSGCVDALTGNA
jgi:glutaredoxin